MIRSAFILGSALMLPALAQAQQPPETPDLVDGYCRAEALDAARCACVQDAFAEETAGSDPELARAMAFFLGQPGLTPNQMLAAVQSLDQTLFPTATMQAVSLDLLAACPTAEEVTAATDLAALSLRDRYVVTCSEGDEVLQAPCSCAADQLQANLDPLEFELIVDIQVAEYNGAEDGFAAVAEARGLTRDEAEDALAASGPSMMAATSAMMGCMATVPGLQEMLQSMPGMGN